MSPRIFHIRAKLRDVNTEQHLWRYFAEIKTAVDAGNRGDAVQPYVSGTFMVTAVSGDIEFTVSDVSEEDAVLIAGELKDMGIRALVRGTLSCPHCGKRVPAQDYCIRCRGKLG